MKERRKGPARAAAVWRPAVRHEAIACARTFHAEAERSERISMASVQLKNIKKVYPYISGEDKKKNKKKNADEPEKKINLQITDEGVVAVQQFSLDIKDKEFIVLVGPSGCGKSTTLRMVAGLEEISGGELIIDGKVMNDVAPKDRDIAMVFQNYALYPHMTVYENMAFSLKLRHTAKDEIDKKVREAARILDITQYLERKPKALSGGQRQRVAIGRAIVRAPKVMLMDEPLSNLDAKLRNEMRAEIIKAMTLGDRIVIMRDGYIQQIGTPQEVFNHPANLFVAGFIGMPVMNFFDAELKREGDKFFVVLSGLKVQLDEKKTARLLKNNVQSQPITLGVRPEHTNISDKGVPAKVDVSEMMGSSVHLHVDADGHDVIIIVPILDMEDNYNYGDLVHFTFNGNVAHVFSKETDKNLEY